MYIRVCVCVCVCTCICVCVCVCVTSLSVSTQEAHDSKNATDHDLKNATDHDSTSATVHDTRPAEGFLQSASGPISVNFFDHIIFNDLQEAQDSKNVIDCDTKPAQSFLQSASGPILVRTLLSIKITIYKTPMTRITQRFTTQGLLGASCSLRLDRL